MPRENVESVQNNFWTFVTTMMQVGTTNVGIINNNFIIFLIHTYRVSNEVLYIAMYILPCLIHTFKFVFIYIQFETLIKMLNAYTS